ncbi:MAG: hypothetical protein GY751_25230 [Bacteroidetes bacterium]|nr:hypothetical protein [Bacteroidota bacterium]
MIKIVMAGTAVANNEGVKKGKKVKQERGKFDCEGIYPQIAPDLMLPSRMKNEACPANRGRPHTYQDNFLNRANDLATHAYKAESAMKT